MRKLRNGICSNSYFNNWSIEQFGLGFNADTVHKVGRRPTSLHGRELPHSTTIDALTSNDADICNTHCRCLTIRLARPIAHAAEMPSSSISRDGSEHVWKSIASRDLIEYG